jgi:hypothetical protein
VRSAFFVLMLLIGPAVLAQSEPSPRQVLDSCIDSLDHTIVGLENMDAACPGLRAAIGQLGIEPLLPDNQQVLLTHDGLINLRTLLERYERRIERDEIGVDSVHSVLEALREPTQAEHSPSWYERFKRWVHEAFSGKEDQADPWLQRWLDEHPVSDAVRLTLFYGVMALVILLAVLIVGNEIRAARSGRRKARAAGVAADLQAALALDSLAGVTRGERASALFRTLIGTLVTTGRLHGAQSLTHRELMSRARFDDSTQSESFRRVARLAEQEVFSGKQTLGAELDAAVEAGRDLNARLGGAAT